MTWVNWSAYCRAGCTERHCWVKTEYDRARGCWVIQHGHNPESVFFATAENQVEGVFQDWLESVHAYADGVVDASHVPSGVR